MYFLLYTASVHQLHMHPPDETLILYQKEQDLCNFFIDCARLSLESGDSVIYLAGTRSPSDVEESFVSSGINLRYHKMRQRFAITTYDEVMLSGGKINLSRARTKLLQLASKMAKHRNIQVLSESNWWLMADVFQSGLLMEQTHPLLPSHMSVFCTYSLDDLLEFARIYHVAKLLELHRHSLMILSQHLAMARDPKTLLRNIVTASIADSGMPLKRHIGSQSTPPLISELIENIANRDDRIELESIVESRLRWVVNG